ncbi:MAG: glycoside hydrolase family 127 protein [Ignavibacteriales bacterium]|nr:glycoside hydrolase family 127 protein [Ignavibacteriales bacterium]
MKSIQSTFLALAALAIASTVVAPGQGAKDYPIKPVPFTQVHIKDSFWSQRLEINRTVTLPHNFKECEITGRVDNFAKAAGLKAGRYKGYQFNDSDVFKAIEGASYSLAIHPDEQLSHYLDSLITIIAAAQEEDGYLYTPRKLMDSSYAPPGGKNRWVGEKDGSHELYNVGHLYEAAVAHYLATGKRNLLDVALKNANLICSTFGPAGRHEVPGHQVIEIGLCKLYRVTGDEKYLKTAKFFLDERGDSKGHELIGEYAQDHIPVLEQDSAVGHSVRAAYMYAGMADVAALTGDPSYIKAIDRIWNDVVSTKMYLTGGIGATGGNEGFSHSYALPNMSAYCETCAAIANAFWNHRMFLLHGDSKYIDVLERIIYNGFLSGVSMEGNRFFYPNPLESFRGATRAAWFECACCPTNVVRFVPSIAGYIYAEDGSDIYVNLFIGGESTIKLGQRAVTMTQSTLYPWDGAVTLSVAPNTPAEFALKFRMPGWAQNRPVPSDLYRYTDQSNAPITLKVNGQAIAYSAANGYAIVKRMWKKGDVVEINFPMPVRRVAAHDKLLENTGRVALERGPVLFCAEWPDNKDGNVTNLVLSEKTPLTTEFRKDLLNGVQLVKAVSVPVRRTLERTVVSDPPQEFTAIPYYAWAHRGLGQMIVWLARDASAARPLPAPTIAYTSKVTASDKRRADAINDQLEPQNSIDHSIPFLHWWPRKGTAEWVQYDFNKEQTVSRIEVYWFDDTGIGECRLPKSWRALYKDGDTWKPVDSSAPYIVEKDKFCVVSFKPVRTTAVRLEVQSIPDFSAGMYEWKVE